MRLIPRLAMVLVRPPAPGSVGDAPLAAGAGEPEPRMPAAAVAAPPLASASTLGASPALLTPLIGVPCVSAPSAPPSAPALPDPPGLLEPPRLRPALRLRSPNLASGNTGASTRQLQRMLGVSSPSQQGPAPASSLAA